MKPIVNYWYGPAGSGKTTALHGAYNKDEATRYNEQSIPGFPDRSDVGSVFAPDNVKRIAVIDDFQGTPSIGSMLALFSGCLTAYVKYDFTMVKRPVAFEEIWITSNKSLAEHYGGKRATKDQLSRLMRAVTNNLMFDTNFNVTPVPL